MCQALRSIELKAAGSQAASDEYPTIIGRMGPVTKPLRGRFPRPTRQQRAAGRRKFQNYMRDNNLGSGDMGR